MNQCIKVTLHLGIHQLLYHVIQTVLSTRYVIAISSITKSIIIADTCSHRAEVVLDRNQTLDFCLLLGLEMFIGRKYFPLFGKPFTHVDNLLHVLILEVYNLFECSLIHWYHLHVFTVVHVLPLIFLLLLNIVKCRWMICLVLVCRWRLVLVDIVAGKFMLILIELLCLGLLQWRLPLKLRLLFLILLLLGKDFSFSRWLTHFKQRDLLFYGRCFIIGWFKRVWFYNFMFLLNHLFMNFFISLFLSLPLDDLFLF